MSSPAEICSIALGYLGIDGVTSIDPPDPTKRAALAALFFQPSVEELITDAPFSCSLRRVALTLEVATPAFDFAFSYALPTDPYCLRVWETSLDREQARWKVEGRSLLTDDNAGVSILYGAKLTDPTTFDPLMRSALEYRLAYKLAVPLVGKRTLAIDMDGLYEIEVKRAKAANGQQGSLRTIRTTALTAVR